jgi:hypothetical protein
MSVGKFKAKEVTWDSWTYQYVKTDIKEMGGGVGFTWISNVQ